jgi:hypothetical protein
MKNGKQLRAEIAYDIAKLGDLELGNVAVLLGETKCS